MQRPMRQEARTCLNLRVKPALRFKRTLQSNSTLRFRLDRRFSLRLPKRFSPRRRHPIQAINLPSPLHCPRPPLPLLLRNKAHRLRDRLPPSHSYRPSILPSLSKLLRRQLLKPLPPRLSTHLTMSPIPWLLSLRRPLYPRISIHRLSLINPCIMGVYRQHPLHRITTSPVSTTIPRPPLTQVKPGLSSGDPHRIRRTALMPWGRTSNPLQACSTIRLRRSRCLVF